MRWEFLHEFMFLNNCMCKKYLHQSALRSNSKRCLLKSIPILEKKTVKLTEKNIF